MAADWKELEDVITRITAEMSRSGTVTPNDKILGTSGRLRQIDVSIREPVLGGALSVLVAVECKRHGRKVGIEEVGEFADKLNDIRANAGVMVSSSGFDAGAVARAAMIPGLQLWSHRHALEADWVTLLGPQAWYAWHWYQLDERRIEVAFEPEPSPTATHVCFNRPMILRDANGKETAGEALFKDIEKMISPPPCLGPVSVEAEVTEPLYVDIQGKQFRVTDVRLSGRLRCWRRVFPLHPGSGDVVETQNGGIVGRELRSQVFDHEEVTKLPSVEIDGDTHAKILAQPGFKMRVDPSKVRRYSQLVITQRGGGKCTAGGEGEGSGGGEESKA